jgi:hypothetical protein
MALIPNTQKFHTVAGAVDTENKGSAQLNAQRQAFTMADIAESVGGLNGAHSVLATSGGTPLENGATLLKAYDEAVTKIVDNTSILLYSYQTYDYNSWSAQYGWQIQLYTSSTKPYAPTTLGQTWVYETDIAGGAVRPITFVVDGYVLDPGGELYDTYVYSMRLYEADGTEITSGLPTDGSNNFPFQFVDVIPATLYIASGRYDLGGKDFVVDDYVNVTSVSGIADVEIQGANVIIRSGADNPSVGITIQGLRQENQRGVGSEFQIGSNLNWITYKNIVSLDYYAYSIEGAAAGFLGGTFINCTGGQNGWGGYSGTVLTGIYQDCKIQKRCFGRNGAIGISSLIIGATPDSTAFAMELGQNQDRGFEDSFAYNSIYNYGTFVDCIVTPGYLAENMFGVQSDDEGGQYFGCVAGESSFGTNSTNVSAYYNNCAGGPDSFSPTSCSTTEIPKYDFCVCHSTFINFGGQTTTYFSGFNIPSSGSASLNNCIALTFGSFGTDSVAYNCRATGGTFAVTGNAKVRNCLDNTNTIINLG